MSDPAKIAEFINERLEQERAGFERGVWNENAVVEQIMRELKARFPKAPIHMLASGVRLAKEIRAADTGFEAFMARHK